MLVSTSCGFKPRAANSFADQHCAKNPRSSSNRSRSITNAPDNLVSVKIIDVASRARGYFQNYRIRLDDSDFGNGNDKTSISSPVLVLLLQNLSGEVPG